MPRGHVDVLGRRSISEGEVGPSRYVLPPVKHFDSLSPEEKWILLVCLRNKNCQTDKHTMESIYDMIDRNGYKKKKGGEKHIDTENGIIDRVRMKIENKKMKKKSNQRLYTTKFLYDMKRTEQRFWNENKCTHEPVTHTDKIFASVHTAGCCALFFLCLFYYLNRCMLQRDGAENENELNTNNNYTSTEWNNCNLISCLFAVCVWNSAIKHM